MNRLACAVAGMFVGFVLMQVWHFLYLRNEDYLLAAAITVVVGSFLTGVSQEVGEALD